SSIDSIALSEGDRVLVRSQSVPTQNGIYVFNGSSSAMTRSNDANSADELNSALVPVMGGTDEGKNYRQTATISTLGSDNVTWALFGTGASAASESAAGVAEIATQGETDTGTDDTRFVTPVKAK